MDRYLFLTVAALSTTLASPTPLNLKRDGSGCCFHLSASGGPGGDVGQLGDGQNRIGQNNLPVSKAQYCLDSNGGLTDQSGRGCILTPPTTQWQCDVGATPTSSFSVGCDGKLQYKGSSDFWACSTGDNGGYNIYDQSIQGEPSCTQITLQSDNDSCKSGCAPPPPSSGCPRDLPSSYEFPHLILPIDGSTPNKAFSNSYNGTACGGISSIFNFDIPASDSGKKCSLEFLLPKQDQLETSSFWLSGDGKVKFSLLSGPASEGMSYASAPSVSSDYGTQTFSAGNAYSIKDFDCPGNSRIGIEMSAVDDTCFSYFQDYNPCPIGLYITTS
ncbi:hypothetical protein AMS68_002137 [Peltaster fructicola]|uniref:Uncharacterized protein n=1 Tax=Peltaster fructicola TaxID=286661 RepID=A0A6H0XQ67_9PEZI|nr:hypothetical protein AMS68_002137 [Peltaster fructicola]